MAAQAAAKAMDLQARSMLMNRRQRWATIRMTVHPKYRHRVFRHLTQEAIGGKKYVLPLWKAWGYDNRLQAYVRSGFRLDTQYYHIDKFRSGRARIALYYVSTYKTGNSAYPFPQMRVVTMRWHNKRWLFVSDQPPAAGRVPGFTGNEGLNFSEMEELYKPYLEPKGFVKYSN
jgi:hypothetical protein